MSVLNTNENRLRGTYDFPFEFHHIDLNHPRYVMPYHWHVEYEIIRIISGEFYISLDERSFQATEGDVVFIECSVMHSGIPDNCVYQCIVFDINTFLKYNSVCAEFIQSVVDHKIRIFQHFSKQYTNICRVVDALFDAFGDKKNGYEMIVIGAFYAFFGLVFQNHYFWETISQTRRDYNRIMQLKKVFEYMENSMTESITLDRLASVVNMSPKYFCRFFSEMTHQTPMEYLNRQRIDAACNLLLTTNESVTEIAYKTGFNNLSYFIRTFKKYKGISPGKYKK